MNQDQEHLQLLSIFHYIVAGLTALFSMLPMFHLFLGMTMITRGFEGMKSRDPFGATLGWLFVTFATMAIALGLAFAVCLALAGRNLARHRGYTFCLVVAAIACLFIPFGTVLGVFTILVLVRPSVKTLFGVAPAPPAAPIPG
ncbi:MAG TPA: hypothetical protein VI942_11955 [Thermoanaerobaculia bacterium]|nr:hypothetical protein [Thermoanaerobaculia bacterium]